MLLTRAQDVRRGIIIIILRIASNHDLQASPGIRRQVDRGMLTGGILFSDVGLHLASDVD